MELQGIIPANGGGDASTARFLAAVSPRYAVISVGAENHFGHPDPSVLGRLALSNARVLRTDVAGLVYIKVFDLTGREVIDNVQQISAGDSRIVLDGRKLGSAGVYLAQVKIAGRSRVLKLLYLP